MLRLLILLLTLTLLTLLAYLALRPAHRTVPVPDGDLSAAIPELALRTPRKRLTPLPHPRGTLRLLRRLLQSNAHWSILTLVRDNSRDLALRLLQLRRDLRLVPRLPADETGVPRMLLLARELIRHDSPCDRDSICLALRTWHESASTTHAEREALPLCLRLALTERLQLCLQELRHDLQQAQQGYRLALRLPKMRRPMQQLSAAAMSPSFADALVQQLRRMEQTDLLSALAEHLHSTGLSLEELSSAHARNHARWAEILLQSLTALRTLSALNWEEAVEAVDPLHALLLDDPSGVYAQMTLASRAQYRSKAARLAKRFRVEETRLVREVLQLCRTPEKDGVLDHAGWYLLNKDGVRALHRRLQSRHGSLQLFFIRHRAGLLHGLLITLNTLAALGILRRGYTLWLLPLFLLLSGKALHFLSTRLFPPQTDVPPQLALDSVPADLRTLVVMPAVLRGRSDAIPTVRRLLLASHTMPQGAVDCLLIADYADSLTATSGEDPAITYAAECAVDALNAHQEDRQFLYLQRRRSYDRRLHRYTGRDGIQGMLEDVCQLIAEGGCIDEWDAATLPPDALHRRYAYVLVLPADATPAPGMLLPLLGALEHPLNRLHASIAKPCSVPDPDTLRTRMGLLHAASPLPTLCFLAAPRSLHDLYDSPMPHLVSEELAGCIDVPESTVCPAMPSQTSGWMLHSHRHTFQMWRHISWLLPWRSAEQGVAATPLARSGRRRLRHALTDALLPCAQLIVLLYAALRGDTLFLLLGLMLPELPRLFSPNRHTAAYLLSRWSLLPLRAASQADAVLRALWFRMTGRELSLEPQDAHPPMENWSQTLAALSMALCSMLASPPCLTGLLIAALFGCFTLIHTRLDQPVRRRQPLDGETESSLMDMAHATWRYFEETIGPQSSHLPPEGVQTKPWRGASGVFHPDDAGLYLLACLSALQLELSDTGTVMQRISDALASLEQLPMWHGLPFSRYSLPDLTPQSSVVDTQRSGMLCACLLCAAQGLRALLPDAAPEHRDLPARLDALAHHMALNRLYDPAAGLFFAGVDTQTDAPLSPFLSQYASPALITSFTAVMLGQVPHRHLDMLDRTRVHLMGRTALCSPGGSASDYLLPLLLLPLAPGTEFARTADTVLRAQKHSGTQGMYGASDCAVWQFDGQMNYRCIPGGIPELALHPAVSHAAAPYAAALCLPFDLPHAHDSLVRLRSHGMLGRLGFFDALDFHSARLPEGRDSEIIQYHRSDHQAILLCALCNALTDQHLTRIFMAIPAAAACSLLLRKPRAPGLILPSFPPPSAAFAPREPSFRRRGRCGGLPPDAHVIGTDEASLLLNSRGCGVMRSHGLSLTRFTGRPDLIEGLQFYLSDGLDFVRAGEAAQEGESVFAEGSIRLTRRVMGLQYTLSVMTDPASSTFLHTLEILNLTGQERFLEIADCLVPAFQPEGAFLTAESPSDRVLTLRCPGRTLCHVLTTADPLIALQACSSQDLPGPGGDLSMPDFLAEPSRNGLSPELPTVCAGFRMKLSLGVRGRTSLVFTTRLLRPGEAFSLESLTPRSTDLPSLLTLSRLACRSVYDALGMNQARAALVSRTAGIMLWHGLPHQGPVEPLLHCPGALTARGLDPALPLMTLLLYTPAGLALLQEAADAVSWLNLSGAPALLCVMCMGGEAESVCKAAESLLSASPARKHTRLILTAALPDGLRETIEAASRLLLYEGSGTLEEQLDALTAPLPQPLKPALPAPGQLPAENLRFATDTGGWQEQTDDYVLLLSPDETAPVHWRHSLIHDDLLCVCTPGGPGEIYLGGKSVLVREQLWLECADGCFSPLSSALPRQVRFSPCHAVWHSAGHGLDMTLTASQLPGTRLSLRALRLKNLTARPLALTLTLAADFGPMAYVSPLHRGAAAIRPDLHGAVCISFSEGDVQFRRMSAAAFAVPVNAPSEDTGSLAVLTLPLTLSAGGSTGLNWVSGVCVSMDELDPTLSLLHQDGASALIRPLRQVWSQRLSRLHVSTPDEGLNLLLNRLLPYQTYCRALQPLQDGALMSHLHAAAYLALTDPTQARDTLLSCAALQETNGSFPADHTMTAHRLLLVIRTAEYVRATGDSSILGMSIPFRDGAPESLHAHCMRALTSIRLGKRGLPMTDDGELSPDFALLRSESLLLGLIFTQALQLYAPLAPEDDRYDIHEVLSRLTAAVQRHGWDGSWYLRGFTADGLPAGSAASASFRIDGLTQAWALSALGASERTIQAVESAWNVLWNPHAGLLRCMAPPFDPDDSRTLTRLPPGCGQNGGADTFCAVQMLEALCLAGQYDRAWLLVRSLNPALHKPDRLEPWLLPGTLTDKGVPLTRDDTGAASLLEAVILRRLLGFELQSGRIHPAPHVPRDWDFFSLTLQKGASTWHFHFSRRDVSLTLDGEDVPEGSISLTDDGHIHQVRVPIR